MQRRDFIKTAAALATAISLKVEESEPTWLQEFRKTGRLVGHDITLRKPLFVSKDMGEVYIAHNTFRQSDDFKGDSMMLLDYGAAGAIEHCTFTRNPHLTLAGSFALIQFVGLATFVQVGA